MSGFLLSRPFLPFLIIFLTSWSDLFLVLVTALKTGAILALSLLQQQEVSDLDNHCHITVLCCPQHGQETERLGQRNCRGKIAGCMGEHGGESHGIKSVTQNGVAAVATASSSKADGSVGSGLPMTQLALLTPAQV